jgi:hypothetical protein
VDRNRFLILCAIVLAGSFGGSFVANLQTVAHAQDARNLRAQEFTLVDPQGRTQAMLQSTANGSEMVLKDRSGTTRVEIDSNSGITLRDEHGRVMWTASPTPGFIPASE